MNIIVTDINDNKALINWNQVSSLIHEGFWTICFKEGDLKCLKIKETPEEVHQLLMSAMTAEAWAKKTDYRPAF